MTAKRMVLLLVACVPMLAVLLSGCSAAKPGWKLAWEENFNTDRLDARVWSKITRAKTPAFKYMSADERCYDLRDGLLVLRGIVNDDREADTAAYLTGGVRTRTSIVSSRGGSRCVPGCTVPWGLAGDLDRAFRPHAMAPREGRLTLWSISTTTRSFIRRLIPTIRWTWASGKHRPSMRLPGIDPDGFNVYGVDIWPDSLVFHVNGVRNFVYPKIETEHEGQFPFYRGQYLMIDMQLGGNWVGPVNPDDLPVEMEIDWVRHYVWKQKGK